jgi:hypothetical protein
MVGANGIRPSYSNPKRFVKPYVFANRPHPPRSPLQGDGSGGFAVLFDGEGEPEPILKVPLPELGEGFRERATKVRGSLPTRTTRIFVSINLRLI